MTWAVTIDVSAPVELYDRFYEVLLQRTGGAADGMLVHLGRPTPEGVQVIEVWESQEHFEHYGRDVVRPVVEEFLQGRPHPEEVVTPFDVHVLLLPPAGVVACTGAEAHESS